MVSETRVSSAVGSGGACDGMETIQETGCRIAGLEEIKVVRETRVSSDADCGGTEWQWKTTAVKCTLEDGG